MRVQHPRIDIGSAFRLRSHHLDLRAPQSSQVGVAGDVCGVQAQFLPSARMALWARVEGLAPGDVDRALWEERTLVRMWVMRGTLHLLPSEELPIYIEALKGSRPRTDDLRWLARSQGIGPEEVRPIIDAVLEALAEGPLTREALTDRVVEVLGPRVRPVVEHTWGGVIRVASAEGSVCYGPDVGRSITFVRCDRWLRPPRGYSKAEAQDALLRRYLHAYGPATAGDFSAWSGIIARDVRDAVRRAGDELARIDANEKGACVLREDLPDLRGGPRVGRTCVNLLPGFDPFLLGHKGKGHLVDAARYKRVYRKAGWISPVVLVDGRVAGVWSTARRGGASGRGTVLTVEPFGRMGPLVKGRVEEVAASLGAFLGGPCEVRYGRVG
jgi:hypothetical protein